MLKSNTVRTVAIVVGILLIIILIGCSIVLGLTKITVQMVVDSFVSFDGSNEHIIIQDTRIPRALIAASIGASLAIAGAIMQGLTRNPLASPTIFGVNAGASFCVVMGVSFFEIRSLQSLSWLAFTGAALTAVAVYILGSAGRDGLTPMKLTLAGAAIAALFSSLTQGVLTLNESALDQVLFWLAGSVQGRNLDVLLAALPYLLLGWIGSLLIGRQMNLLAMGEDVAISLGQRTFLLKLVGAIIVVFLAGGAVAVAGPIGFIGIVIPHVARWFVGIDYRWVIPSSGILGAILLLSADIGARYIMMPAEVPVGVMTAFVGVPFFIFIARRGFNR